jgi:class 3 adenylate cyclase
MIVARLLDKYKENPDRFKELFDDLVACRDDLAKYNSKFDIYVRPAFYAIEAEVLRHNGDDTGTVIRMYNAAIESARSSHYLLAGAIALTRYASFAKIQNLGDRFIGMLAHDAVQAWVKMGFTRVQNQVAQDFKIYISGFDVMTGATVSSSNTTSDTVDMQSYTQVSQLGTHSDQLDIPNLFSNMLSIIRMHSSADRCCLIIKKQDSQLANTAESFIFEAELGDAGIRYVRLPVLESGDFLCLNTIQRVIRSRTLIILEDAVLNTTLKFDKYIQDNQVRSVICMPIHNGMQLEGCLYLENRKQKGVFTELRTQLLKTIIDVSIENARLFTSLNASYARFLPTAFLTILNKDKVMDVQLGDAVEQSMCVMFSDIRNFTSITEKMSAKQSFQFVNDLLAYLTPAIERNDGLVDKFIGDAVMSLFALPNNAISSLKAACAMQIALARYNRTSKHHVSIGVGIHYGQVMLGTIGTKNRLNATVISDTVNIASRLEGLTKAFGCGIIVTSDVINEMETNEEESLLSLHLSPKTPTTPSLGTPNTPDRVNSNLLLLSPNKSSINTSQVEKNQTNGLPLLQTTPDRKITIKYAKLGRFYLKGKDVAYELYEIYTSGNEQEKQNFADGLEQFSAGNFKQARETFIEMAKQYPSHLLCRFYEKACVMLESRTLLHNWRGEIKLDKDGGMV